MGGGGGYNPFLASYYVSIYNILLDDGAIVSLQELASTSPLNNGQNDNIHAIRELQYYKEYIYNIMYVEWGAVVVIGRADLRHGNGPFRSLGRIDVVARVHTKSEDQQIAT